jgi:cyanophycinase
MAAPLVALVGGEEFQTQAAEVDLYVVERLAKPKARVAVLPTAAAPENAPLAAQNGVRHFHGLGVEAKGVMIVDKASANDERLVAELEGVDLVYIAGGDPAYLLDALRDSLVWQQLRAAVEEGRALAGSSAGAMILGQTMYYRRQWFDALGLVPGICVLPHFEQWGAKVLPDLLEASTQGSLTLLGIDGATGCVGWEREWEVVGPGAVTVIRKGRSEVFRKGGRIQL